MSKAVEVRKPITRRFSGSWKKRVTTECLIKPQQINGHEWILTSLKEHLNVPDVAASAPEAERSVQLKRLVTHRFHKTQIYWVRLLQRSCQVGRVGERSENFWVSTAITGDSHRISVGLMKFYKRVRYLSYSQVVASGDPMWRKCGKKRNS